MIQSKKFAEKILFSVYTIKVEIYSSILQGLL